MHTTTPSFDLTIHSSTFPTLPSPCVPRDNLVRLLHDALEQSPLVTLSGQSGIGKTIVLALFAKTYPDRSITIFLSATRRWAINTELIQRDLAGQIAHALGAPNIDDNTDPIRDVLSTLLQRLHKQAATHRRIYYFIIDGLDELSASDYSTVSAVIDHLHVGAQNFRFLASPATAVDRFFSPALERTNCTIPGFTSEETRIAIANAVPPTAIATVHETCAGVPSRISSLLRQLNSGHELPNLLSNADAKDWLSPEWGKVIGQPNFPIAALALLAFDRRKHTLDSLARTLNTQVTTIAPHIQACSFLVAPSKGELRFISADFKTFACKKLANMQQQSLDLAIDDCIRSSEAHKPTLPALLSDAGRHTQLLEHLSPEHVGTLIARADSWVTLHDQTSLGVNAALRTKNDPELLRMSMSRAAARAMERSTLWEDEVEAYAALGDYASAEALVGRAVTREDRLHVLSVIAASKKSHGLPIDRHISHQITELLTTVDRTSLGQRGVDIASFLIYTEPDSAVELLTACTGQEGTATMDSALLELSIQAMSRSTIDERRNWFESTHSALKTKTNDSDASRFMGTLGAALGGYKPDRMLQEVAAWPRVEDRLMALRSWCLWNEGNPDSGPVIEYAINLAVSSTATATTAAMCRDLLSGLARVADVALLSRVVARLDGIKATLCAAAPTLDFVDLQLTLAEAEARVSSPGSLTRLQSILAELRAYSDSYAQTGGYSKLLVAFDKLPEATITANAAFRQEVLGLLDACVRKALDHCADHIEAVRDCLRALAQADLPRATALANDLNTQPRRDEALAIICRAIATRPSPDCGSTIQTLASTITDAPTKALAVCDALEAIWQARHRLHAKGAAIAPQPWLAMLPEIADHEQRCLAGMRLSDLLALQDPPTPDALATRAHDITTQAWDKVADGWSRVKLGFRLCTSMASRRRADALATLQATQHLRERYAIDTHGAARNYMQCLRIAMRAFGGVAPVDAAHSNELHMLKQLVAHVPSPAWQAYAWTEIALRVYLAHGRDSCSAIVHSHLRPMLEDARDDSPTLTAIAVAAAPALCISHLVSAKDLIDALNSSDRDEAYGRAVRFLLSHRLPEHVYDSAPPAMPAVSYETAVEVCHLMEKFAEDRPLYWSIELLVDAMQARSGRRLSNVQQAEVLSRIEQLVNAKLPNPKHIRHEGYRILAEGQLLRARRNPLPQTLVDRARAIPNACDRGFVLMHIAAMMRPRERTTADALLQEARAAVPTMALLEERISRLTDLAKTWADINPAESRACIRQAWQETTPMQPSDLPRARRSIIDFAHRLDPKLAEELAAHSEKDPGREAAKEEVQMRLAVLQHRRNQSRGILQPMPDARANIELVQTLLVGLQSDRDPPLHQGQTRELLAQASRMDFSEACIVIAWAVENARRRYEFTQQKETDVRPMFAAACLATELVYRVASRMRSHNTAATIAAGTAAGAANLHGSGEREGAIAKILAIAAKAPAYIRITDPYFSPEDLDVVGRIRAVDPTVPITILTSRKHQTHCQVSQPWDEAWQRHWRLRVRDVSPGDVQIIIVGGRDGSHPIHDRWLVTEAEGLRFGTSMGSIGGLKVTEVSHLDAATRTECDEQIVKYSNHGQRGADGELLRFLSFALHS